MQTDVRDLVKNMVVADLVEKFRGVRGELRGRVVGGLGGGGGGGKGKSKVASSSSNREERRR